MLCTRRRTYLAEEVLHDLVAVTFIRLRCNARRYGGIAAGAAGAGTAFETTRCRDTERTNEGPPVVATRARWRVESACVRGRAAAVATGEETGVRGSRSREECDGAGEGKAVYAGFVVVVVVGVATTGTAGVVGAGAVPRAAGRPCAVIAFMTVSHARSSVRMRSLSSVFSRSLSRSRSARRRSSRTFDRASCDAYTGVWAGVLGAAGTWMPARSRRFSSSSSATRRSRKENCAFRRSREFCAAMRLRCARASLRCSESEGSLVLSWLSAEVVVRGRLREGPASSSSSSWVQEDDGAGDGAWNPPSAEGLTCVVIAAAAIAGCGLWAVVVVVVRREEELGWVRDKERPGVSQLLRPKGRTTWRAEESRARSGAYVALLYSPQLPPIITGPNTVQATPSFFRNASSVPAQRPARWQSPLQPRSASSCHSAPPGNIGPFIAR